MMWHRTAQTGHQSTETSSENMSAAPFLYCESDLRVQEGSVVLSVAGFTLHGQSTAETRTVGRRLTIALRSC